MTTTNNTGADFTHVSNLKNTNFPFYIYRGMVFLVFIMNLDVNFNYVTLSFRMGQLYKWVGPGPLGPLITLRVP